MTSVDIQVWGAGGGGSQDESNGGGGGGYAEGTLAVTAGQVLYVNAGQGGKTQGPGGEPANGDRIAYFGGGEGGFSNGGGGGVFKVLNPKNLLTLLGRGVGGKQALKSPGIK